MHIRVQSGVSECMAIMHIPAAGTRVPGYYYMYTRVPVCILHTKKNEKVVKKWWYPGMHRSVIHACLHESKEQ